jgi:hypothetical protein
LFDMNNDGYNCLFMRNSCGEAITRFSWNCSNGLA